MGAITPEGKLYMIE